MHFDEPHTGLQRRGFLAAGAGVMLCTIGGERVVLRDPGDARKADAAARRVGRPRAAAATVPGAGPTDRLTFSTPTPKPRAAHTDHKALSNAKLRYCRSRYEKPKATNR